MKKIKIILANAPINNGNRGCVALSITSLKIINDILFAKGIEADIYLPDSAVQEDGPQAYHIEGFEDFKYIACNYPPAGFKSLVKAMLRPKKNLNALKVFKDCDYIMDIGQGDSFADIYGARRFAMIDKIHKLARLFHKPYCLLPQTIGPFNDEGIRRKASKSIEKASLVMARDEQSYNYVKEISQNQNRLAQYIDVAFLLPYKKELFDGNYIHVGLNISALLWNGGYTRNNQFGLKVDYPTLVRSIVNHFLSNENVILHLIPHVVEAERGVENDYAICYDVQKEFRNSRLVLAPFFLGPCEAKGYISGLDFFMGARMHATIAAFSSGVPVVPMAYSRKFNGLFEDTLDYKHMVDLKQDSNEIILKTIISFYDQRGKLKGLIRSRLDGIVEEKKQSLIRDLTKFMQL